MDNLDDSGRRRRDVLKKAGAAAAGLTAFSATSVASAAERKYAKTTDQSQRLLNAVGNPSVQDATTREIGNVTGYILETELGRLVYTENEDGQHGAQFHIDRSQSSNGKSESGLARKQTGQITGSLRYEDIPSDGKATLIATPDGDIEFVRAASESERAQLEELTGLDADESKMFYSSPIDGFEVHSTEGLAIKDEEEGGKSAAGATKSAENDIAERAAYYVTPGDAGDLKKASVEAVDAEELASAQGRCGTWASRCMQSIVICSGCAFVCISVPVTNIPGVAVCITCVMGCHFAVPLACGKVLDECA